MENDNKCFIKDIYAAASLLAVGKRLLELHKGDNFYWFVFEDKFGCEKLLEAYWKEENSIPPKVYADAIRTLKDRLFSQK